MPRSARACKLLHASTRNGVSGHRGPGLGRWKGQGMPRLHETPSYKPVHLRCENMPEMAGRGRIYA